MTTPDDNEEEMDFEEKAGFQDPLRQATPRPWSVEEDESGIFIRMEALAGQDEFMGIYASPDPETRRADAALIVQAVNAHDSLVAALKAILRSCRSCRDPQTWAASSCISRGHHTARAALAKAKGG